MSKIIKCSFAVMTYSLLLPSISYAVDVTQGVVSNLQSQAQSASSGAYTAIQNAPSQLLDAAAAAGSSGNQAQQPLVQGGGTAAGGSDNQNVSSEPPVSPLPPKPSLEVLNVDKTNPYTNYPEGVGNYNINAHEEDEVLPEQSDFVADESLHEDEIKIKPFDGFYLGVNGLYAFTKAKDKGTNGDIDLNGNNGGFGGIFGYSVLWGSFYLGGDLFLNYLPYDESENFVNGLNAEVIKIKSNYDAGIDLKIGGTLSKNLLLYGSVGIDMSTFDITSESWSRFSSPSQSKTAFGIAPGIGLEYALTRNLILRTQFKYVIYQNIEDNYYNTETETNIENKYDISRGIFLLGLDYHFH